MKAGLRSAARFALVAACFGLGFAYAGHADETKLTVIKMSAKRFVFVPDHLTLKKGETVDIELVTEDVPMGFSLPDFAVRSDILPGTVSHLKFTPNKTGTFTFLCDLFCGSGHEDMNGIITVVD